MLEDPGLFECMYSMRAMRRLKPDPVPEAMVERILEAATRAPSGQNTQPWAFLVVTEEAGRRSSARSIATGCTSCRVAASRRRMTAANERARFVRPGTSAITCPTCRC